MKDGPAGAERPVLLLTVLPTQELWVWTLTDGAGLARVASGTPALAQAEALSVQLERGLGGPAESARLGQILFPGDIGDCLAQSAATALTLQLHPSLDRLAWEQAWVGRAVVGQRYAVARQPLLDDEAPQRPAAASAGTAALRVLRVLPAGAAADAETFDGETAAGADVLASWSRFDVVLLPKADSDGWTRLPLPVWPDGGGATLLVATVTEPAAALVAAQAALRHCTALLLARHDGAASVPAWWPSLLRQLGDGVAPDVAVRQIRRDHAAARPAVALRLFGQARAPLRRPAAAPQPAQLRQLTVLSVDVVGSTRWLHELGAERYSLLLREFHDLCGDVMHRHGGVADDPQGDDGLMAYFGYPLAGENVALRAVAAGLALVQAVAALGIELRVGVATGLVAIQADTPVGVVIHLAARLQNQAPPGAVLVAGSTRALLGAAFDLAPLPEPLHLKGIDGEQAAWRVCGHRDAAAGAALPPPRDLPLVGREAEIATLRQAWDQARGGRLQVALVQGEAGIGKSRLLRELRALLAAEGAATVVCRGLPDTRHSPFVALAATLRRLLGIHDDDPPSLQLARLERGLPAALPRDEALPLAAALLSLPLPLPAPAPERWREQTLALLLRWFQAAAETAPLCLQVEDTHWLDASTREFLNRLVHGVPALPMLVLATRRSDEGPGWEPSVAHASLVLRGLPPSAARWLVRQASGEQRLPADVVRLLAARADGVPLFLEQSVRVAVAVCKDGALAREQLAAQVPSTLHDLLMARIDRLAEAKPTAQLAAALGRSFPWALLQAVVAQEFGAAALANLPARVQALEQAGLVVRSGDAEHLQLSFRHALLRDTAYQSMWQRDRRHMHQAVAGVLQAHFAALVQRQPELLAYHLSEAGRHDQALAQWDAAARLAIARWANDEAIAHLESALAALAALPAGAERDRTELRLQTLLAARCIAAEGYGAERVERVYARAAVLCEQLADRRAQLKVELGLHAWHFMHADFARAHQIAQRALAAAAEAAADPLARVQARWSVGITLWHQGRLPQAVRLMDECLLEVRPSMHRPGAVQDPGVMCGCYSAWGQWELGEVDDAVLRIERVLATVAELDHRFSLGLALGFASSVHHFRGETGAALEAARRAVAVCEEGGFTTWLAHARMMRGRLHCEAGEVEAGLAEMTQAYAVWVDSGAQVTRPLYLAMQAEGLALAGRAAEGIECLLEALALADRTGERYHEAELRRLLGALTLQVEGAEAGVASARRWFTSARELALAQGKRSFVLRAELALCRLADDVPAAAAALRDALQGVHGGDGTRDVQQARDWLALHGVATPPAPKREER